MNPDVREPDTPVVVDVGSDGVITRPPVWYKAIISKVENGFTIKVGCKTFVSESWIKASKALAEYWDDPEKAERKYAPK